MFEIVTAMWLASWAWGFFLIALFLAGAFGEDENLVGSTAIVVVAGFVLWYFDKLQFVGWSIADFIFVGIAYFIAGIGWAAFKWDRYVSGEAARYKELKLKFIKAMNKDNNLGWTEDAKFAIPTDYMARHDECMWGNNVVRRGITSMIPNIATNKQRVGNWLLWWPASFLYSVLVDMLLSIKDIIVDMMGNMLNAIARRHYKQFQS